MTKCTQVDKITELSVRPPELRCVVDMVENYFRWFYIEPKPISYDKRNELIHNSLYSSARFDGFQRKVKVRKEALTEIILLCEEILTLIGTLNDKYEVARLFFLWQIYLYLANILLMKMNFFLVCQGTLDL